MIMEILDIIANTDDYNLLKREVKAGTLAKATMLISKDSLYANSVAKLLAVLLLNGGEDEKNENYQRVMLASHPDVKTYPQKDRLLVADSEEIVLESYALPVQADKKIFIIKDFDSSTESAQNKLLKILEEPPKNVYMILTCSNVNQVLPTIRSRCNKYELAKLDEDTLRSYLLGSANSELISVLSYGYLGRAEELLKMKNLQELFTSAISVITDLTSSKEVLLYSKKLLDYKEHFELIIEIISLAIEDMLAIKAGRECRLKGFAEKLKNVEGNYSVKAICQIQELLNKAVKEQTYNVNLTLIIENLLLNILEVKFICK